MNDPLRVHLFVLEGMADWEAGHAVAELNRPLPNRSAKFQVQTVGLTRSTVRSMGGLQITPDLAIGEIRPSDSAMLILPGADLWADSATDPALEKAREFVAAGVPVAAICGATLGLARAGLLDERRHTSNDPAFLKSTGYLGAPLYVNEAVADDRGIITASAMASLEFARAIFQRLQLLPAPAIEAWYNLFKTRDGKYFFALQQALQSSAA